MTGVQTCAPSRRRHTRFRQDEEAGENTETEGGRGKDRLGGGQREALMNEASSEVGGTEAD